MKIDVDAKPNNLIDLDPHNFDGFQFWESSRFLAVAVILVGLTRSSKSISKTGNALPKNSMGDSALVSSNNDRMVQLGDPGPAHLGGNCLIVVVVVDEVATSWARDRSPFSAGVGRWGVVVFLPSMLDAVVEVGLASTLPMIDEVVGVANTNKRLLLLLLLMSLLFLWFATMALLVLVRFDFRFRAVLFFCIIDRQAALSPF
jgi:hypothetical protein